MKIMAIIALILGLTTPVWAEGDANASTGSGVTSTKVVLTVDPEGKNVLAVTISEGAGAPRSDVEAP